MTLYELTCDLQALLDMAEDPEIDGDTLRATLDTLEAVNGEIEDKADGYAKVIRQMQADSEGLKAEIARLTARKKHIDDSIDRMTKSLQRTMTVAGRPKIKTELFTFTVSKNPPRVVAYAENLIPKEYYRVQDPVLDKKALGQALKDGQDIPGAYLEQTEGLRIR